MEKNSKTKERWERAFAVLLVVLPWVRDMPVAPWGLLSLLASTVLMIHMWVTSDLVEDDNWSKNLAGECIVWFVITILAGPLYFRWQAEQAIALEGDLSPLTHETGHILTPVIQLGFDPWNSILDFSGTKAGFTKFLYDADFRVEVENGELVVTTPVRDKAGHVIATITKNHWVVAPPPQCWDKNYTRDTLEILDSGGNVVLQIRILADRVQLQGEWHDGLGNGFIIQSSPDHEGSRIYGPFPDKNVTPRMAAESSFAPIFQYPSKDHWGQYERTRQP